MKVVDNRRAGIEFSDTTSLIGEYAQVNGALIVGRSNNAGSDLLNWGNPIGFVPPAKTADSFTFKNARFYNFDWAYTRIAFPTYAAKAISTCSSCIRNRVLAEDAIYSGGSNSITTSGLFFDDATVPRRITFKYGKSAVFLDLDGTLTG